MRLAIILFIAASLLSSASCVISVVVNSPPNFGRYTVNTSIPINISVSDISGGGALSPNINVTILLSNTSYVQYPSLEFNGGYYNGSFIPNSTGVYEGFFNASNDSCSNFSAVTNFYVFGSNSIKLPETNVYVVLFMFVLIVGYFKWNHGQKNTRLKK